MALEVYRSVLGGSARCTSKVVAVNRALQVAKQIGLTNCSSCLQPVEHIPRCCKNCFVIEFPGIDGLINSTDNVILPMGAFERLLFGDDVHERDPDLHHICTWESLNSSLKHDVVTGRATLTGAFPIGVRFGKDPQSPVINAYIDAITSNATYVASNFDCGGGEFRLTSDPRPDSTVDGVSAHFPPLITIRGVRCNSGCCNHCCKCYYVSIPHIPDRYLEWGESSGNIGGAELFTPSRDGDGDCTGLFSATNGIASLQSGIVAVSGGSIVEGPLLLQAGPWRWVCLNWTCEEGGTFQLDDQQYVGAVDNVDGEPFPVPIDVSLDDVPTELTMTAVDCDTEICDGDCEYVPFPIYADAIETICDTSGTYTPPRSGFVVAVLLGGGGGGGWGSAEHGGGPGGQGGGGGGEFSFGFTAVTATDVFTHSIGLGGYGGSTVHNLGKSGTNGGTTSVSGPAGGSANGGVGGYGDLGDSGQNGANGGSGAGNGELDLDSDGTGGNGGFSYYQPGGTGGATNPTPGDDGDDGLNGLVGSGGGGGGSRHGKGGDGGDGRVVYTFVPFGWVFSDSTCTGPCTEDCVEVDPDFYADYGYPSSVDDTLSLACL